MRYLTEPRDRIYVKVYGLLSFVKKHEKNHEQKLWQNHKQ